MLLGSCCPLCGHAGDAPCAACRSKLEPPQFLDPPPHLAAFRALFDYHGTGRSLVAELKFHNGRVMVPWLARQLAAEISDDRIEVVTWAPTSAGHRRRRGFDQAEVLARRVAGCAGLPARKCLVRLPGPPQTGRHRHERLLGPRFDARRGVSRSVCGRRVAVVDDVATTGATLTKAAEVLIANGATSVIGVVLARTPVTARRTNCGTSH